MIYRNISDKPAIVLKDMSKISVAPGDTVNLSIRDQKHSGSSMRFFEAVNKVKIVTQEKWDEPEVVPESAPEIAPEPAPVTEPVTDATEPVTEEIDEPTPEPVIEEDDTSIKDEN